MKKDIEILLKKEGEKDITVKCPEKIKLSGVRAFFTIQDGLLPLDIKPVDMKGLGITILAYLLIFVACAFFMISPVLGVIALLAAIVFNFIYTKNYFFNFIKKKISEGYTVEDSEQKQILTAAGIQLQE